jgi:nucleoid-associated protein EbfC
MFGDKFNLGSLLKNAKKIQEMAKKAHEELAKLEVIAEAGAGAVKVTMSGDFIVKNIQIEPDLLKEDVQVIEELVAAAVNDALQKVKEYSQRSMLDANKLFGEFNQDEEEK